MSDIVKLYNPANAAALTPEQIEGLQKLDSAQIKELAKAYPNGSTNYLLIIDNTKPVGKQIPTLSTFENLWNLREKNAQKKYVAFSFRGTYKPNTTRPVAPRRTEVLDLSETELMTLPGFKTAAKATTAPETTTEPQTIKVTKVKRTAKTKK